MWKVDLHSHTIYSKDCLTRPEALIRRARAVGLDKLAVTEHNNLAGALAAKALAPDLVIVGEEIKTTEGEIIAYFVTEEVPRGLTPQATVERLRTPEGGAVVSNQNITPRKRAELDAEQRRQELMHVSRVSAMGELAASLAHELNQPLTGVMTNAQAAVRLLASEPPDLGEIREILADIIDDDRRAG